MLNVKTYNMLNGIQKFALKTAGMDPDQIEEFQAFMETKVVTTTKKVHSFGQASLEDGTTIYFPGEELTEGSIIYSDESLETIVGAQTWTLENGDVITTGEDGGVISIAPADAPAEDAEAPAEDVEAAAEVPTEVEAQADLSPELIEVLAELDRRIAALEGTGEALKTENAELSKTKVELSKELGTVKEEKALLSKNSAATPNVANAAKSEGTPSKRKFSKGSIHQRIQAKNNSKK